jgi:hypothetical protein
LILAYAQEATYNYRRDFDIIDVFGAFGRKTCSPDTSLRRLRAHG